MSQDNKPILSDSVQLTLDLSAGEVARDEAIAKVTDNSGDFMALAFQSLIAMSPGEYTGEDIRIHVTGNGIVPHHHNAWGALIMSGVRSGILINTERTKKMLTKTSHARRTFVYEKR